MLTDKRESGKKSIEVLRSFGEVEASAKHVPVHILTIAGSVDEILVRNYRFEVEAEGLPDGIIEHDDWLAGAP